jgi:sugar phosphate isomerase/epimerase
MEEIRMKYGVSSYSFARMYNDQFTQLDAAKKAKEMGFDFFELAELHVPEGKDKLEYAKEFAAACKEIGIGMGNYTIGADFLNTKEGSVEGEIERLKKEIDVAEALGATGVRHDATAGFTKDSVVTGRGFPNALPYIVQGYKAVTEYAQTKGIRTMIENHGRFCQESQRVEQIICGVNSPNFGALIDVGNFTCADENPTAAVGRLAPFAFHVHAKDFIFKSGSEPNPGEGFFTTRGGNYLRATIIGQGNVPVYQCFRILKESGYDGTLAVEFEGMEDNLTAIRIGLANLKKFWEMA